MFIIDDIINAIGAGEAAKRQEAAANRALMLQQQQYTQQRADQAPWLQAGQNALGDLTKLQNDPNSIQNSSAFQFRMQQGQQALERSASARGGLSGGGFAKGLARYSQGLASDEYGNQWNRLAGLAGVGQNSAQSLGNFGSHYADAGSSLYGAQGNAQAAGIMGITNGAAGAVRSAGNIATLGMGGGLASLGIPGMGGGGGGGGGGAMSAWIPRQPGYG